MIIDLILKSMVYDKANEKVSYYYAKKIAAVAENSKSKKMGNIVEALIFPANRSDISRIYLYCIKSVGAFCVN